ANPPCTSLHTHEQATKIDDFRPGCNSLRPSASTWGAGTAYPRAHLVLSRRPAAARRLSPMPDNVSALTLVLTADPALMAIVRLAVTVGLVAAGFGALIGVPIGAAVALTRFAGREVVIVLLNALMGLPPVVVGVAIYLLLSRAGPLGSWGLLFTPQAM